MRNGRALCTHRQERSIGGSCHWHPGIDCQGETLEYGGDDEEEHPGGGDQLDEGAEEEAGESAEGRDHCRDAWRSMRLLSHHCIYIDTL